MLEVRVAAVDLDRSRAIPGRAVAWERRERLEETMLDGTCGLDRELRVVAGAPVLRGEARDGVAQVARRLLDPLPHRRGVLVRLPLECLRHPHVVLRPVEHLV